MKKDNYNSKDEEFQHVIKLLKELPKENAPDNFEFNLLTKIENQNFETTTDSKKSFFQWKLLVPAAGTAAAAIVVFFSFFNEVESFDNPFQINPQPMVELGSNVSDSFRNLKKIGDSEMVTENDVLIKESIVEGKKEKKLNVRLKEEEKLASSASAKLEFPFDNSISTDLDKVLKSDAAESSISRRARLTGRSNSNSFFNGFFIREEVDKEYVVKLKARMDSLKNELKKKNNRKKAVQ